VGASSCALLVLAAPAGAAAGYSGNTVVPGDGRLNTPDYHGTVTAVAWPARNGTQEPTTGRRFVRFMLEVRAPNQSASPTNPTPSLGAALRWNGTSHALSLTSIDDELQAGAGGSSETASASYIASVPNDTHDVDLVLSEGTFSQNFDLWTLRRVPPSPTVLYRDPTQTAITGTSAEPAKLSLSNPTDAFTSLADVTLQSATLGFFTPPGATLSPNPDQAVLSVVLDGEFPNDPSNPTGSGHYLGSTAPLPANMLSFSPSGGTLAPATISDVGDTTGKGNSDDGLFDATYSFLVPATLTSGTLEVAAGSFSGAEFTLYTAERGTTTIDVSQPATLALTFRSPVAAPTQRPAVGRPTQSSDERGFGEPRGHERLGRSEPYGLSLLGGDRGSGRAGLPRRALRALASDQETCYRFDGQSADRRLGPGATIGVRSTRRDPARGRGGAWQRGHLPERPGL
jgi:hypothetical protein